MSREQQQLLSILKIVQLQQIYIYKIMHAAVSYELKEILADLYSIYRRIELEIFAIASSRRWDVLEVDPISIKLVAYICHCRLLFVNNEAKIAISIIRKNIHHIIHKIGNKKYDHSSDSTVMSLSNRLLVCVADIVKRIQCIL